MSPAEWEEPGIYEVAPDVYRIPLPLPGDALRCVNVYALAGSGRLVLIDAGWALDASFRQLALALAQIGCTAADVREFLITHVHRDHYTQAVAIRRRFGTAIALGDGERPSIEVVTGRITQAAGTSFSDRLARAGAERIRREWDETVATGARPQEWEAPDRWLTEAASIAIGHRRLEVIATPGHTAGHVVYADSDGGLLFAGDHVLPHITPSIGLETVQRELPLRDYLESLALIRARPDAMLLPAHGPVASTVHRRIDELIDHHEQRFAECLDAVVAGSATAAAVSERLRWTRRRSRLAELDTLNAGLAVGETLAHLDVLAARGLLVAADSRDGVRYFAAA